MDPIVLSILIIILLLFVALFTTSYLNKLNYQGTSLTPHQQNLCNQEMLKAQTSTMAAKKFYNNYIQKTVAVPSTTGFRNRKSKFGAFNDDVNIGCVMGDVSNMYNSNN